MRFVYFLNSTTFAHYAILNFEFLKQVARGCFRKFKKYVEFRRRVEPFHSSAFVFHDLGSAVRLVVEHTHVLVDGRAGCFSFVRFITK